GGRAGERDALVSGAEQHVEVELAGSFGGEQGLGVEAAQLAQQEPVVETASIEEIGGDAARLGGEFAEGEDAGAKTEANELRAQVCRHERLVPVWSIAGESSPR